MKVLLSILAVLCAANLAGCASAPRISDHQQARALSNAALLLMNQGDDEGAIKALDRVIAYNGGQVEDYTRRATANATLERHAAALNDLDKAIEMDPKRWRSYLLRAVTNQKLSRYGAAIHDLTVARTLQPNEIELLRRRAYLEVVAGRFDAAARDYQELAEVQPRASTGPFGHAVALYLAGDWKAAAEAFALQVAATPTDGIVTLWLAKSSLRSKAPLAWEQFAARASQEPEWTMVRALLLDGSEEDLIREMATLRTAAGGRRAVGGCEYALFMGAWAEIKGAPTAQMHFESARKSCPDDSIEGAEARTELLRLQAPNASS